MKIIAFNGFKQSGKDSCVNYLKEKHNFKRISFADPLKDMVSSFFKIPRDWLDNPEYKEKSLKQYPIPATDDFTKMISEFMVREFKTINNFISNPKYIRSENGILQTFTNSWENLYHSPRSLAILLGSSMRAGTSDFWVKKAIEQIKDLQELGHENIAISDLRYKSECKQLRDVFGEDLLTIRINRFDSSTSSDPSELDLIDYPHNFCIENKGTKEELFLSLENVLKNNLKLN